MAQEFCCFCCRPMKMPADYKPNSHKVACSWACYYAEKYFTRYMSDEEQTMRKYWKGD